MLHFGKILFTLTPFYGILPVKTGHALFRNILVSIILIFFVYINLKDDIFNSKTLYFGTSIPKTGIMNAWGSAVYNGANAYFSYVNEYKLLNGKQIKLIAYDDKYEPELTKDNIHKLISEFNIFAFFGFVGTPTVKNILPTLEESNIPLIAPFTGASFLRNTNNNIINFRSSYQEEINHIVKYLHTKKSITQFAVFYQNDIYGEEGFVSLLKSLEKRGLTLAGEGTYKRNTLSIRHAFNEIKDVKPQAVIMVGAYKANALFIKTAKKHVNFKDTIFCNISFGDANEMIKELNFKTDNLLFSQVVPSYNNYDKSAILEYKNMMKRYYPHQPLGFISLESFLAAKTVVSALKKINGNITQEKFVQEIKKLPNNILGDFQIAFKNNQLHNKTYLFEYKDSKFIEVDNEN